MKYVKKFNESTEAIKIYIVLYCFWEGDGYLINKYEDCFLTEDDAISLANTLKYSGKPVKIYLPGEEIPDEGDGGYGTPAFVQIVKKEF
jgi:hypothetical protein